MRVYSKWSLPLRNKNRTEVDTLHACLSRDSSYLLSQNCQRNKFRSISLTIFNIVILLTSLSVTTINMCVAIIYSSGQLSITNVIQNLLSVTFEQHLVLHKEHYVNTMSRAGSDAVIYAVYYCRRQSLKLYYCSHAC